MSGGPQAKLPRTCSQIDMRRECRRKLENTYVIVHAFQPLVSITVFREICCQFSCASKCGARWGCTQYRRTGEGLTSMSD